MFIAQIGSWSQSPEMVLGILALVLLGACGIWALVHWITRAPLRPDPWDSDIAQELGKDETVPLCHRCLAPHDMATNFCRECGAPVGDYTNLLPFPYLFSIGHTLRIGTSGEFRRSPLTVFGFFLLAVAEYTFLAPVYWFVFLRKLLQSTPPPLPTESTH